ncbi:MAG TPA: hypothetical protein VF691_03120 [Cytophagaceae bacterium]
MNYSRTAVKKTWAIISIVLAVFALLAANYSKSLEDFIILVKPDDIKTTYGSIFNYSIKLFLGLLFIIIWCLQYIVFLWIYEWNTLSLKQHKISSVTSDLLSTKELNSITIFGYSISFAEELRFEIAKAGKRNLKVTLIVPSEDYITDTLCDDQTKASRTSELSARIEQWKKLETNECISTVVVKNVKSVPVENGFLVNDEVLYIDYYIWSRVGEHYKLNKKPKNDRGFLKVKSKNHDLFNYIKYQLETK